MLSEAVQNQNITLRELSVLSGVSYATVYRIAHQKTELCRCRYLTVKKLSDALHVSPEILVQTDTFRHFRDDLHRELKGKTVNRFLLTYIENGRALELYRAGYTIRAMYLMCMLDYLCRLISHLLQNLLLRRKDDGRFVVSIHSYTPFVCL